MRRFTIVWILFALGCSAHANFPLSASAEHLAQESTYTVQNGPSQSVQLLKYFESGLWQVREIEVQEDGWQDTLSRQSFATEELAEGALLTLRMKYSAASILKSRPEKKAGSLKGGTIWKATQRWSWDWEKKYADWISTDITPDFFQKHNIATDCADVAYATRWIFARMNGLPAANRISGSGGLLTNESLRKQWTSLPTAKEWHQDRRFLTALNYLLNEGYTHSLVRDSYP
ncbi:MAG: hypothetical protein EOP06_22245, partial [Proteobacteria bacterium]